MSCKIYRETEIDSKKIDNNLHAAYTARRVMSNVVITFHVPRYRRFNLCTNQMVKLLRTWKLPE